MHLKLIKFMFTIILITILSACSSEDSKEPNRSITTTFVDSPVSGLEYRCSSANDIYETDENGKFTCQVWDEVTFILNDLITGKVTMTDKIVTPYSLFPNNNLAAVNLARLLQSLDTHSEEGILHLNKDLLAKLPSDLDFTSASFAKDVEDALEIEVVSAKDAKESMDASIIDNGGEIPPKILTPTLADFTGSILENSQAGTIVGTLEVIDTGLTPITSMHLSGTGSSDFNISNTGVITLSQNILLDYETTPLYNLTAVATSEFGNSNEVTVNITILDVNEIFPPILKNTALEVSENSPHGTVVGNILIDSNGSSDITTITLSGAGHANFLASPTGVVTTSLDAVLDFETNSSYSLTATATNSSSNSNSVDVNITILDVNEIFPPILKNTALEVSENSPHGTIVGNILIDSNGSSDITAITLSGAGHANFLASPTGVVTTSLDAVLDFETNASYNLTATATNSEGISESVNLSIHILDIREVSPLPILKDTTLNIVENSPHGTVIGSISIEFTGTSKIESITLYGPGHTNFSVTPSGEITVASNAILDFEQVTTYNLTAIATNGYGNSNSADVNISVTDIHEEPTLANSSASVAENSEAGVLVGNVTINSSGSDAITAITLSGDGHTNFSVAPSGEITVASNAILDFEQVTTYNLTAIATNAYGNSNSADVNISILNVNETSAPTLANSSHSIIENAAVGAAVGYVNITSSGSEPITSIALTGAGSSNFTVATNGLITTTATSALDYETTMLYNLHAVATNAIGNSASVSVAINVLDYTNPFLISKLKSDTMISNDYYGTSVDVSGDYIVVSTNNDSTKGSVFLYKKALDGSVNHIAKIETTDVNANTQDSFGYSVSISGDYILVGAPYNDTSGMESGAAYLFKRNSDTIDDISEIAKITASDASDYSYFGSSVSIDGNYMLIGAPNDANRGSAYLYKRNSDTTDDFTELSKINSTNQSDYDRFAQIVSISGDYMIIGSPEDDINDTDEGSAYVFKRNSDTNITELSRLQASDVQVNDKFGYSVDIDNQYLVIGTSHQDMYVSDSNGESIYLFKILSDTSISELSKVSASSPIAGQLFGTSVTISADYIVAGSSPNPESGSDEPGNAYIFQRISDASNGLSQIKVLQSNLPSYGDNFASSVSIDGDTIVAGAYKEGAGDEGGAYIFDLEPINKPYLYDAPFSLFTAERYTNPDIFTFNAGSPTSSAINFTVSGTDSDDFTFSGSTLSYLSQVAAGDPVDYENPQDSDANNKYDVTITATDASANSASQSLNVEVTDKYFLEMAKLKASDAQANDGFGGGASNVAKEGAVSISGDYIVVGAPYDDDTALDAGSVYLFKKQADKSVIQIAKFQAADAEANDGFGNSVSISGDYIIVGAMFEDTGASYAGSAYLFRRNSDSTNDVTQIAKIQAGNIEASALFGNSVTINGDYIIVGAYKEDVGGNTDSGSAYLFKRASDTNVSQIAKLSADISEASALFGSSVSLNGDLIAIGAPQEDADTTDDNRGVTYVFQRNSDTTNDTAKIAKVKASDRANSDNFGHAVSINGSYFVVGAYWKGYTVGSAYLYKIDGQDPNGAKELKILSDSNVATGHLYGSSVAIQGNKIIVGAPGDNSNTPKNYFPTSYVFQIIDDTNIPIIDKLQTFDANTQNSKFGMSVAVDADFIVVGAPGDDTTATDSGSAHVFMIDPNQP